MVVIKKLEIIQRKFTRKRSLLIDRHKRIGAFV